MLANKGLLIRREISWDNRKADFLSAIFIAADYSLHLPYI